MGNAKDMPAAEYVWKSSDKNNRLDAIDSSAIRPIITSPSTCQMHSSLVLFQKTSNPDRLPSSIVQNASQLSAEPDATLKRGLIWVGEACAATISLSPFIGQCIATAPSLLPLVRLTRPSHYKDKYSHAR